MRVLNLPRSLVFAMACAALTPAMAQEQTRAELQQENRALRDELEKQTTRISQLESRVDQLLSERRSLMGTLRQTENLISNLRRQLGATDAPPQRRLMAQPPDDALASPESMLRELRNQYRVNMLNQVRHVTVDESWQDGTLHVERGGIWASNDGNQYWAHVEILSGWDCDASYTLVLSNGG